MFRFIHSALGFGAQEKSIRSKSKVRPSADVRLELLEDRSVPASFTAGNLAVVLADGVTALATAVHIVEFNTTATAQTAFQTIDLPTTAADAPGNGAITQSNMTSEGFLSRTQDKQYLLVTGYNVVPGTTAASGMNADRIVGRIGADGVVDSTTRVPGVNLGIIRSAASKDGSTIYVTGALSAAAGVTSLAFGTRPTTANVITSLISRQVGVFGDTLLATSASGSNFGASLVGTAGTLPTLSAPAILIGTTTSNAMGIYALDRDAGVPGIDQVFVADPTNGLRKFSFNGTAWALQGTLTGAGNFFSVALAPNGTGTDIYATTGSGTANANNLVKYTDTASYNAAAAFSSTPIVLATAAAGRSFRGVTFAPEVSPAATSTTLVATPLATTGGMLVTLIATVGPSPGNLGTVTFKDNGVAIAGGANVALAGGAAMFTTANLSGGTHPITADFSGAAGFSASTSNTANVLVSASTPPHVVNVTPNGNIASLAGPQRSRVVSLVITFDQPVQLDANALTLEPHTKNVVVDGVPRPDGFGVLPTSLTLTSADNLTWVVTFEGNTDDGVDGFNSLKDGVYDLNISAAKVHPNGVAGIDMPANSTTTFHRLFGDTNDASTPSGGTPSVDFSAIVNSGDNLAFRNGFNSLPNYKAILDFNGDGIINSGDNFQFRTRFNKMLSWTV